MRAVSGLRSGVPCVPGFRGSADGELLLIAHERHLQQQRLEAELLQPALLTQHRRLESQLRVALRVAVDQRRDAELLREAAQLADRGRALVEIDKVNGDAPFGEEAQGGASSGALLDPEDLNLHAAPQCDGAPS